MRSVTRDAKLLAAATSDRNWTMPLLTAAAPYLDYISIHGYWDPLFHVNNPASYIDCMMKTDAPEADIQRIIGILNEAGLGDGRIKIAYDEWNLRNWHHPWHGDLRRGFDHEARRKNDIASTYTMADALFSACFLNACLRHADMVDMACFSPIVNTRGSICVYKDGIVKRTTYYVFQMYTSLLEEDVVPVETKCDRLTHGEKETGVLDVVLTADEARQRLVYVLVNKSPTETTDVELDWSLLKSSTPKRIRAKVLSGTTADDYNERGHERVVPKDVTLTMRNGRVSLPPHSLTFLTAE